MKGDHVKVRKAVIPAAGLGTRFLPITKTVPKEMLPLLDRPIIQEVIEESVLSGIRDIVLVTGMGKNSIEDYFDISAQLERFLAEKGKESLLERVKEVSRMVDIASIRQKEPKGLGHAVQCSRSLVGDNPFAVLLGRGSENRLWLSRRYLGRRFTDMELSRARRWNLEFSSFPAS
jgi:UTP--glucose-1-phosphate uridylyltransferase